MVRRAARALSGLTGAVSERSATTLDEVVAAHERGDHELVLRLTDARLAQRPGDDAAHEYRARAFLALGRPDEAERHAADAVRLDPDEIRYRELLAQTLSASGAHRDAAAEYGRLAANDPRQTTWTVAEAEERLGAAQPRHGRRRRAPGGAAGAGQRARPAGPRPGPGTHRRRSRRIPGGDARRDPAARRSGRP